MSSPRSLYPDTTLDVTVRCVHRSYRLVPKKTVSRVIRFAFAVVCSRYREKFGMRFYESEFLSRSAADVLDTDAGALRWQAGTPVSGTFVFPVGTVRMRLGHNVVTEPVPLDLFLAALARPLAVVVWA